MKIRLADSYTFDASAQTVVHASFSDIGLDGIQLITNVTDNVIIYQFNSPSKGGTLATDTLTLTYDTTSMSDTDELMILVEDGSSTQPVSGSVTADTELTTADLDTGGGTDTRAVVGLVGSKSGGGALIPGDATAGLKVDLGADNDVTVTSGSITATQGTAANLNMTEASAAAIKTAVEIIDDWDESDRAKVNLIAGQAGVAGGAGATGATTQRVVTANDHGKTILSTGGSASSSGNNTLVSAGSAKLKVKAFSLTTTSTTAVTCIFQSGAGGTELWRVVLQAPSGASTGANLSVAAPDYLFATASATLLNLNLSSADAVHWSVSYYDEA